MSGPLEALARIGGEQVWLVGGAVRNQLLGRENADYDVAYDGDPERLARALAREAAAHPFALSEQFGAWRVVARDHSWQLDVLALTGATIEQDLRRRDFTINAIARSPAGGEYVDPTGGVEDLRAGRLRMVSPEAFAADPLRTMRMARFACELGFEVEPATAQAAAAHTPALERVASERVFSELRLILCSERPLVGLELLEELGATAVVLPELTRLHGIEQSPYHHLDVYDHTRAVLSETIALVREPEQAFAEHAKALRAVLAQPLASELTRGQALRFGALFHDIAKPETRAVGSEGRVTFFGHDRAGAEIAVAALRRLRAGERLAEYVAALTSNHLRLGFLVHEMPLDRRAIYRYLKSCDPVGVEVTVLSVADRLATRGKGSAVAIEKHLTLARQMLGEALAWLEHPPHPPVRGDELARAAGIRPGPELGRVLAELEEASFAGEIDGAEQALARGRELLASR